MSGISEQGDIDDIGADYIIKPASSSSTSPFKGIAHAENRTMPNAGGDLSCSFTATGGLALILCDHNFQDSTNGTGYQHLVDDNGSGVNLIPFQGTQKPVSTVSHINAPVELGRSFWILVTLAAGAHTIRWNLAFALSTNAVNLSARMVVLYN